MGTAFALFYAHACAASAPIARLILPRKPGKAQAKQLLKRFGENLNRGIPTGPYLCFILFGRMDHVSTIAICASDAFSEIH